MVECKQIQTYSASMLMLSADFLNFQVSPENTVTSFEEKNKLFSQNKRQFSSVELKFIVETCFSFYFRDEVTSPAGKLDLTADVKIVPVFLCFNCKLC